MREENRCTGRHVDRDVVCVLHHGHLVCRVACHRRLGLDPTSLVQCHDRVEHASGDGKSHAGHLTVDHTHDADTDHDDEDEDGEDGHCR
jgi:hypothetical protein